MYDSAAIPPSSTHPRRCALIIYVALPNYAALGLPILGSVLGDASHSVSVFGSHAALASVTAARFDWDLLEIVSMKKLFSVRHPALMFGESDPSGAVPWAGAPCIRSKCRNMLLA